MDFEFDEDTATFGNAVRRFAKDRLAPGALERAHDPSYPWDAAQEIAAQGLLGLTVPVEKGGQGARLLDAVVAIQEVAMACPKSADIVQAGNFGAIRTFAEFAPPDLLDRYLPDLLDGKALMGLGMTEPDAGSAVTQLKTSAKEDGGGFVLDGTKVCSTNSADASVFLVYVRYGPGTDGIGSVVVERGTRGLTVGPPSEFMSGEVWCPLYFDGCRIPASNVVLGPGGFRQQMSGFNVERIGNAARALALGRHAFELAKAHAVERTQFGRPLCEFQGIQWKFADMALQLEDAQLLLYRAATAADRGLPSAYDTSIAKLACNEAGFSVANESLQVMGALGFTRDTLVKYCLRRTRGWMIAGGSLEILRNRIAESIFDRRFDQRGSGPPNLGEHGPQSILPFDEASGPSRPVTKVPTK
jgi:alkylation response protein AidB-like acyl-CoA dehydrogenase